MRAPSDWLDAGIRYAVPLATVLALLAAALFLLPAAMISPSPAEAPTPRVRTPIPFADTSADPRPAAAAVPRQAPPSATATTVPQTPTVAPIVEAPPATPTVVPTLAPPPTPAPTATPAAPLKPRPSGLVPIIMYHHVGPLPPNPDLIRKDLTVAPENFEAQLKYLKDNGIETVHLDRLSDHWAGRAELPGRGMVLTFDDGYDDAYKYAFPLLKKYGMVGTFFITTDFLDRPGYLTWAQIEEMAKGGMSIQAHSANHGDLSRMSAAELKRQLEQPKRLLEERLGISVPYLAYPAGKYNRNVIVATKAAGYAIAVTVNHGTLHASDAPYEVTRVRARGSDSVRDLAARFTPQAWQTTAQR